MKSSWIGRVAVLLAAGIGSVGCAGDWWPGGSKPSTGLASSSPTSFNAANQVGEPTGIKGATSKFAGLFKKKDTSQDPYANDSLSLANGTKNPDAGLFISMAKVQESGGNVEAAIQNYNQALSIAPKNVEAIVGMARLLDRQGRLIEATTSYQMALELSPRDASTQNDLALCLARRGMFQQSIATFRQAISIDPENPRYRNNLATVLTRVGEVDEAVAVLEAAHGAAVAHYNVGFLLQKEGRSDEALGQFYSALSADPSLKPAQTWITQLEGSSIASQGVASQLQPANTNIQSRPVQNPVGNSPAIGANPYAAVDPYGAGSQVGQTQAPYPAARPQYLESQPRPVNSPAAQAGPSLGAPMQANNPGQNDMAYRVPQQNWGTPPRPSDPFTTGTPPNSPVSLPATGTEYYPTTRY